MLGRKELLIQNVADNIGEIIAGIDGRILDSLEEIRLRTGRPIISKGTDGTGFWSREGRICPEVKNPYIVSMEDITATVEKMSQYSVYAFIDEIKQGFITIKGGHRIGLCGRVVLKDGAPVNLTDISGMNIRLARQVIGAADKIMGSILDGDVKNTLIISPPGCGKTTLLRDIARQMGDRYNVGIIDERSEIAACFNGEPQLDVGSRVDVLDLCPKAVGINMMVRSMSPDVIITDEIATDEDMAAVDEAMNSGVKVIASAHGSEIDGVANKLKTELSKFGLIVILGRSKGAGTIEKIIRS